MGSFKVRTLMKYVYPPPPSPRIIPIILKFIAKKANFLHSSFSFFYHYFFPPCWVSKKNPPHTTVSETNWLAFLRRLQASSFSMYRLITPSSIKSWRFDQMKVLHTKCTGPLVKYDGDFNGFQVHGDCLKFMSVKHLDDLSFSL